MTNHSRTALSKLKLDKLSPRDLIAPNFRFYELTRSELGDRLGIVNGFTDAEAMRAAVYLARRVLQPLRDAFGAFTPNSVYRSQALEQALKKKPAGWISTSQHTRGCACDVEIVGKSTLELARWAAEQLSDYDQIICECFDPRKGPNSGWVHISLKPPEQGSNRQALLSYIRDPGSGQMLYVSGLRESIA
jgi:hypothetical protein